MMTIYKEIKCIIFDFGGVIMNLGDKYTSNPINLAKIFNISEERALDKWGQERFFCVGIFFGISSDFIQ